MNGRKDSEAPLLEPRPDGWLDFSRSELESAPAAMMKEVHREKLRLCEALEEIADMLPAVDRLKCLAVANALVPLLRSIHHYEESVIFPAYEAAAGHGAQSVASTRRLRAEHVEDQCFADDLTEVLLALGHGKAVENAEVVGFMLRGFFETIRRHVAFEREHVLPLIEAGGAG